MMMTTAVCSSVVIRATSYWLIVSTHMHVL